MTAIRWLVLKSGPHGTLTPVTDSDGSWWEFHAPSRAAAESLVQSFAHLPPGVRVISRLEFDEIQRRRVRR